MSNKSSPSQKQKDIKIKPEDVEEQFGEDLLEQLIITFVERDYEEKKSQIQVALQMKDAKKLKYVCHTFKTTARMLCIEDFALECQEIETCAVQERVDWNKMENLVSEFLIDFQSVYEDAKQIYEKNYKPKEPEILEVPLDDNPQKDLKLLSLSNIDAISMPEYSNHDISPKRRSDSIDLGQKVLLNLNPLDGTENQKKINKIGDNFKFFENNEPNNKARFTFSEHNEIFDLDVSKIKINLPKSEENNQEFKNNLKTNLIEKEIVELSTKFKKSIENLNKEDFLQTLKYFKTICGKYHFDKLFTKVEEWEEMAVKTKIDKLGLNWSYITQILLSMVDEANKFIARGDAQNANKNAGKNATINLNNNQKIYFSGMDEDDSQNNQVITPVITKKVIGPGSKNNTVTGQVVINKNDDVSFLELKPVKFDCLYKKEMSSEELAEEIKKISQEGVNDVPTNTKVGSSMRNLKANPSAMVDCTYPFKNEAFRFDCIIL